LHSEYSLLDGGNRIDKLVARVAELGMDSVAVTDHGNLHAAVSFYTTAKKAGIKPILGVEAYVAPGDRRDRSPTGVQDGGFHLVLLAENLTGWNNLLHLCSQAYLTGFYYKPRMDRELLAECGEGLIAINGHLGSELAYHLNKFEQTNNDEHYQRAIEVAQWHQSVFAPTANGPRFYVEMQHHIPEQNAINPHLIRLARELDLPLVCDNDSHFLLAENHDAHDTLICISTGKLKSDEQRMRYPTELYVKSPEQMWEIFGSPSYNNEAMGQAGVEALENTVAIAARCDVELSMGENYAPVVVVETPEAGSLPKHDDAEFAGDLTAWFKAVCARFELQPASDPELSQESLEEECDRALRMLCEAGMVWRYGAGITEHRHECVEGTQESATARDKVSDVEAQAAFDKWARLNRELLILSDKSISAYFLIVWDFVNWGRQRGIPSLARGSGVGTMTGYVLGLSNACPVHFGLLFERFTDPDRKEYPDIDIDLCQNGRGEVIRYVREKYGHVAQIITFGTLKARAAIRDVCRVHEVPLPEADRLAKLIPDQLNITLDEALKAEPDLRSEYETNETVRRVIDTARVLEGQARHASVHAAGVIVATVPLDTVVPLYKQSTSDDVITQWDGPTCEGMGLLKMDFLGLRTLSVIERARQLIAQTLPDAAVWAAVGRDSDDSDDSNDANDGGAHPLDLDRLSHDDPRVFAMFERGDTTGVFQFESGGMRRLLQEMKPDRLEDLIAANALFRPGPMDLIPDYNRRKHGQDAVPKVHPIVDRFTEPTYGVMVYQEQVMQIVHELGGIPLRAAYSLIKAISKKKAKVINAERPKFIEGAKAKGLHEEKANELFELILKFAGYGFNKSHSTGYAIVAYQTAYLKTYFPRHYMAAFLTFESQAQKVSDWIPYLEDCRRTWNIEPRTGELVSQGVEVRAPSINTSGAAFEVVFDPGETVAASSGHIRFGLTAIKGVGARAIEGITAERSEGGEFTSIYDFCERCMARVPGLVNKTLVEALIKSGSFDVIHGRDARASLVATTERALSAGQRAAADAASGQGALFGGGESTEPEPAADQALAAATTWSEAETLRQEKETLGFYVSSHPLESWKAWAQLFATHDITAARQAPQDTRVTLPAIVQSVRTIVLKQGKSVGRKMGIVTIEDLSGTMDAVLFAESFGNYGHLLEGDEPIFVLGRVDLKRGDPQIVVDALAPISAVPRRGGSLRLVLSEAKLNGDAGRVLDELKATLAFEPTPEDAGGGSGGVAGAGMGAGGKMPSVPVQVWVETADMRYEIEPRRYSSVRLVPETAKRLRETLGPRGAKLVGGASIEVEQRPKWQQRGGGE